MRVRHWMATSMLALAATITAATPNDAGELLGCVPEARAVDEAEKAHARMHAGRVLESARRTPSWRHVTATRAHLRACLRMTVLLDALGARAEHLAAQALMRHEKGVREAGNRRLEKTTR